MTNLFAMFPGQGSQKVGMGSELFTTSELAKELFEKADKSLGFSLSKLCFDGPAEELTATKNSQPAILTVSVICYELFKASDKFVTPLAAAGHSLGEYSALVAANSLAFEDAVQLVHKRGTYMQEAVPVGQGKMFAILGKEIEEIELALSKVTDGVAEAANINAPGQIVVAGDVSGMEQFRELLTGAKIIELEVSAPFHCSLMKPAEIALSKDLDALSFKDPEFPIYANYTAEPTADGAIARENLKKQVCGRVRWVESIQNAIENVKPTQALEFGEGRVLAGLMKKINRDLSCKNVSSIESIENL